MRTPLNISSEALRLLEQVSSAGGRATVTCDTANRTAEFVLLATRLTRSIGLPVSRLLEVGCGCGYSLRLWAEVSEHATGLDLPEAIKTARAFLREFPPPRDNIALVESRVEDLDHQELYDLVVSQYILEHVDDVPQALARIRRSLKPGGTAVHVLNNSVSRTNWYVQYRSGTSVARRLWRSARARGILSTAANPGGHTPPHEPRFGTFDHELEQYALDRWTLKLLRAGFEITDWFQTSDINWVLVTRVAG